MTTTALHMPGAEGANTLPTPGLQSIELAVNSLYAAGGIVVVDGAPGVGKSFGVKHTLEGLRDKPIYWADMPENPKGNETTARIFSAVTGSRPAPRMTAYELTEDTCEVLDGLQAVLVIDEVQNMSPRGLKQLRYLHDRPTTQVLLLLLGNDASKAVAKVPPLQSRVARTVPIKELQPKELKQLLPELHPLFAATTEDVMSNLATWARGNLRAWVRIIEAANSLQLDVNTGLNDNDARLVIFTITGTTPSW